MDVQAHGRLGFDRGGSRIGERTGVDHLDAAESTSGIWIALTPRDRAFLQATGLVRLTAAARWLGMSPESLRRHVHEGRCSGRKFDGDWFVGRGTVERWRLRRGLHLR